MAPLTILWLGILIVLALLFVATLRRMSMLVARTRELERYQAAVESLDRRFATAVGPLVRELDEARRHAGDPETLRRHIGDAQGVLAQLQADSRALQPPPALAGTVGDLVGDVDRATRAVALIEHGAGTLAGASLARDLEGQTSLKRGALNLRHAREAFGQRAAAIAGLRPADLLAGSPRLAALPSSAEAWVTPLEDDPEARFDPRM